MTIYCEETDEDVPIFDWDSIEPRIKYEIDTLAERIDSIRLTVDISDIENFPIEYEGGEYSLSDVALISKNGPREFLVDFIEYPELFEQVANALHDNYSGDVNVTKIPHKHHVVFYLPKINQQTRNQRVQKIKKMSTESSSRISQILQDATKQVEVDMKTNDLFNSQTQYYPREVKEFTKTYKNIVSSKLDGIISAKEKELLNLKT